MTTLITNQQDRMNFTSQQLAEAYNLNRKTIVKMLGNAPPSGKRQRAYVWNIGDISTLNDTRKPIALPEKEIEEIETNPDKMKPSERRLHFQAEDLKQASLLKSRKNAIEARVLIPALEVEVSLAQAFKKIALMLDTLPDSFERDGIISNSDISKVIDILDRSREGLANDLSNLSPKTEDANNNADW